MYQAYCYSVNSALSDKENKMLILINKDQHHSVLSSREIQGHQNTKVLVFVNTFSKYWETIRPFWQNVSETYIGWNRGVSLFSPPPLALGSSVNLILLWGSKSPGGLILKGWGCSTRWCWEPETPPLSLLLSPEAEDCLQGQPSTVPFLDCTDSHQSHTRNSAWALSWRKKGDTFI